jgi:Rab-GTPase-TBC domain
MLCYIIEDVLPRDYYTTMVSLTADINLLVLFLVEREPQIVVHLKAINFELPMVIVEMLITIFTTNRTEITDIIMDAFLIDGSRVYLKVVLLFFRHFREDILHLKEFCRV